MITITGSSTAVVDFNNVEADGTMVVPRRSLRGLLPSLGEAILLEDLEGRSCSAFLEATSDTTLTVRPVWETWREPPFALRVTPSEGEIGSGMPTYRTVLSGGSVG